MLRCQTSVSSISDSLYSALSMKQMCKSSLGWSINVGTSQMASCPFPKLYEFWKLSNIGIAFWGYNISQIRVNI